MPVPEAVMLNDTFAAGKQILVFTGCADIVTGLLTVSVTHEEVTVPQGLVTITWYAVPFIAAVTLFTFNVDDVAPAMLVKVPVQLDADCHWYVIPLPVAVIVPRVLQPVAFVFVVARLTIPDGCVIV